MSALSPEMIDAMIEAGLTREQMAALMKANLAAEAAKDEERRAKAAAKKRKQRANKAALSPDVPGTDGDTRDNGSPLDDKGPQTPKNTNPLSKENPPKGGQKKGSVLPTDWQPTELDRAYGRKLGLTEDHISRCAEKMRNWAAANAHREVARKVDWSATFKNWMQEELAKKPPPSRPRAAEGFI